MINIDSYDFKSGSGIYQQNNLSVERVVHWEGSERQQLLTLAHLKVKIGRREGGFFTRSIVIK